MTHYNAHGRRRKARRGPDRRTAHWLLLFADRRKAERRARERRTPRARIILTT